MSQLEPEHEGRRSGIWPLIWTTLGYWERGVALFFTVGGVIAAATLTADASFSVSLGWLILAASLLLVVFLVVFRVVSHLDKHLQSASRDVQQLRTDAEALKRDVKALKDESQALKAKPPQLLPKVKAVMKPTAPYEQSACILRVAWLDSEVPKLNTALSVHLEDGDAMDRHLGIAVLQAYQTNGDLLFTLSEVPPDGMVCIDNLLTSASGQAMYDRIRFARGVILPVVNMGPQRTPGAFAAPPSVAPRGRFA